jgi:GNAT superfamily N-acetyltransferase
VDIGLLADRPRLTGAVGELRWREWGDEPGREELPWWVQRTREESGREVPPVTFVVVDASGAVAGAVGLGEFDIPERRDRSPWVLGMIVRPDLRGGGVGRALLAHLRDRARERGHDPLWVATGDRAVGFYEACGWRVTEAVNPQTTVLTLAGA